MNDRKKFISDSMLRIILGFTVLVGLYIWKYNAIPAGWRFFGMVFISMIASITVQLFMILIRKWIIDRLENKRISDICRTIGVPEDFSEPEDIEKYRQYVITRYSPDLLVNRLSDVIWVILTTLRLIFGIGIIVWYLGVVVLYSWDGIYGDEILLWLPLFLHLFISLCIWMIDVICNIMFNRYPGEARGFNKKYDEIRKADAFLSSNVVVN